MTEDDHHHCPNGCEKPQPCILWPATDSSDAVWICGRCLHEGRGEVVMVRCTPEICD